MNGYRIFQVTKDKDGKETQGIYPIVDKKPVPYDNKDDAIADYEVRLGQALASDNENQVTYLLILGMVGEVVRQSYTAKTYTKTKTDAEGKEIEVPVQYEISPRLIDIKVTEKDGEVPNMAKYDTVQDVHSNFHLKLGRAMQNTDTRAIVLYGIDPNGSGIEQEHWVRTYEAPAPEPTPEPENVDA
jgi:hypothetical protein